MKRAQRTTSSTASSINKSLGTMKAGLVGLASGLSIGLFARGLIAASDAAKKMDAQLRLATNASGNFAKAQQDVIRIANTTRTGLEETANLYATFQRNAVELGISQEQAARATETVSKSFQISGATAAEASGGLRQFLQAIQSGVLRGEELNSVLENAPRLARLLADSLGVTIGQLREMGKEGELTGDKLIAALTERKFTDAIDAEFKELPVTFDQAMTLIQNAAIITFGAFDRGGEFSKALVDFITDGSDGFADLAVAAENLGIEIRAVMAGLDDVFEPMLAGAQSVFGQIESEAVGLKAAIADILGALDGVNNYIQRVRGNAGSLGNLLGGPGMGGSSYVENYQPSNARGRFLAGANRSALNRRREMILGPDAMSRALAEFGSTPAPTARRTSSTSDKKKKTGGGRKRADDSERKRLAALRDAFQFDQELLRGQMDILRARQDLAVSADERAAIERQMLDLDMTMLQTQLQYEVAAGEKTQAQADLVLAQQQQVDAMKRQAIDQEESARLTADANQLRQTDYDIQLEKLEIESSLATTGKQKRDVELRILDAMQAQEKARLEAVLADQQSSVLARAEAQKRLDALNANYGARREQVMQGTAGPMESAQFQYGDLTDEMESLRVDGIMAAGDALATLATEGFGAFKDQAISAIKAVIAEFIRMQMIKMLFNVIGGGMGGGMGAGSVGGGSPFSNPVMGFATGGAFSIAGRPGVDKNLMSINGIPIARVSHGERVSIDNVERGSRGGNTFNMPLHFSGPVSRETMLQAGAKVRAAVASANRKGG
jgi:tape measure domain-containing protein